MKKESLVSLLSHDDDVCTTIEDAKTKWIELREKIYRSKTKRQLLQQCYRRGVIASTRRLREEMNDVIKLGVMGTPL